jgi:hypothetical protein
MDNDDTNMAKESPRLKVVMQEKNYRLSEMLEYNKRLDRTVVLYITAAYAAIGLQATNKLDLSAARTDDRYVWLVFLFIFLNGCILLHAVSQSCWCMSIAKFIHLKLNPQLDAITGDTSQPHEREHYELDEATALGWDDWRREIKGVANNSRDMVVGLWMLLVLASSVCSVAFVDLPDFLKHYPVGYLVIVVFLIPVYWLVFSQVLSEWFCVSRYHSLGISFSLQRQIAIGLCASVLTAVLVYAGYYVATLNSQQPLNSANTVHAIEEALTPKGAGSQPATAVVPVSERELGEETQQPLFEEFRARKEQVLNLEMRLFVLILALEGFFCLVYVFNLDRVRSGRGLSLGATLVYFILFFEMVAINGKMGLISMYLRQMETYMASLGYVGAVWESKALDQIIFCPGNAFTLPAGIAILLLLVQTMFVVYLQVGRFSHSSRVRIAITTVVAILLLLLVVKTITVDFHSRLPQIFTTAGIPQAVTIGDG